MIMHLTTVTNLVERRLPIDITRQSQRLTGFDVTIPTRQEVVDTPNWLSDPSTLILQVDLCTNALQPIQM
jgi:hypothetical protein